MNFKKVFKKLYLNLLQKIKLNLSSSKVILPPPYEQQIIIEKAKLLPCNSRFIVTMVDSNIIPLFEGDKKYPFSESQMSVEQFLQEIVHPTFLIPYLAYAEYVQSFAIELQKIPLEQLFNMHYQIFVPLKLHKEDTHYSWYKQKSMLLTVNGNHQIHSHINFYEYERDLMETEKTERRFIEATILQNEVAHSGFQQLLKKIRREYFQTENVFEAKHLAVLKGTEAYHGYSPDYKNDLRKDVLDRLEQWTGYRFINFKDAKDWLLKEEII